MSGVHAHAERETRELVAQVESLLARVEGIGDPAARGTACAAVQALVDLYGEGLARIVGHVAAHIDDTDAPLVRDLIGDELVAHLLMLHGLHPDAVEHRVRRALEAVRPDLQARGGDAELIDVGGGVARVRLHGSCRGHGPTALKLRVAAERAIRSAAPELDDVQLDGAADGATHAGVHGGTPVLVPLERRRRSDRSEAAAGTLPRAAP